MKERLYFAYGSNMDPRQMRERCPQAVRLGAATLDGHRFLINRRGVATIEKDSRASVMGVLWRLGRHCEETLDRHEGVLWGFYRKAEALVRCDKGRILPALVYIDPVRERGIPREGYLERVLLGAKRAGIPSSNFASYFNWLDRHAA